MLDSVSSYVQASDIIELYAGSGNFSIPLAKQGAHVRAVEADEALVALGTRRAEDAGVARCLNFIHSTCERFLKRNELAPMVLVDPPRSGMKELLPYFKAPIVQTVVYVSCSLPTLTRDLRSLCDQGFQVEQVKVVDMFAQTHHVEMVTLLKRQLT